MTVDDACEHCRLVNALRLELLHLEDVIMELRR